MGQKVHPVGFRLGIIRSWDSKWYEEKNYAKWLHEDIKLREFVKEKLGQAGISRIEIERAANKVKVNVHTARPGIVIGKRGAGIETIKKDVQALTTSEVYLNVVEVRKAETDAQLVAENIATQLERRIAFRRAMKKAVQTSLKFGAKGIRVATSGRLGGSEMARYEWYREGRVPLHTLRADIDYGFAEARTTYGKIGVKVWVMRGEVLPQSAKVPRAGLGTNKVGDVEVVQLDVTGEISHETAMADRFRYAFTFPTAAGAELPVLIERELRPGNYHLRVKVQDINSAHAAVREPGGQHLPVGDPPLAALERAGLTQREKG